MSGQVSIDVHHGTVVIRRDLPTAPDQVFKAFANAEQRAVWGAPSDTAAFIIEQDQFREGGIDLTRCGSRKNPEILIETRYLAIDRPHLILAAETIRMAGRIIATNLTTTHLCAMGREGTQLLATVQVASLVGAQMVSDTETGTNGSLDALTAYLARGEIGGPET